MQQRDGGYFGADIYFSDNLQYAVEQYGTASADGLATVLVAAVCYKNVYPVIEEPRDANNKEWLHPNDGVGGDRVARRRRPWRGPHCEHAGRARSAVRSSTRPRACPGLLTSGQARATSSLRCLVTPMSGQCVPCSCLPAHRRDALGYGSL